MSPAAKVGLLFSVCCGAVFSFIRERRSDTNAYGLEYF